MKIRKKYKINQKNMGGMIGVNKDTVSRWENGKNIPHKIALRKMEEILAFKPRLQGEENSDIEEKNK